MAFDVEVRPGGEAVARRMQAGDRSIPAGRVCVANATVKADKAAAGVGA
jgi:hypothetical protein